MDKEYVKPKKTADTLNDKIKKGDTLDYYNDDLSLKAVGKLFEEKPPLKDAKKPAEQEMEYEFLNLEKEKDVKKLHDRYTKPSASSRTTARPTKRVRDYDRDMDDSLADYDDEPDAPPLKIVVAIISVIFLVILLFLIYKVNSVTNQLKMSEESASQYAQLNQDYQSLKIENEALQTQVASLQAQLASNISPERAEDGTTSDTPQPTTSTETASSDETEQNAEYTLYTVVQGDSLSRISQKFYGTQGQYQRIKDYNGMTNDNVAIGQVLKIPK